MILWRKPAGKIPPPSLYYIWSSKRLQARTLTSCARSVYIIIPSSTSVTMDNNVANLTTLNDGARLQESDPVAQLISTFLTARSDIYRELAELRREASEPMTR